MLLFFVRSGLNFKFESLFASDVSIGLIPLFLVSIFYTVVRILGTYVGAYSTGFKEISSVNENDAETKTDVQLLIEQVHNI